jgi:hypothetical protein
MRSLIAMPTESIRRRLRISLRTTMLVIVVVAIWLSWNVNRAREQHEAVAAVQNHGGWVHYDYEFVNGKLTSGQNPWAPRWLRRLLGDEFFRHVSQVSLVYDQSTGKRFDNANVLPCDDVLARICRLPGLKSLLLKETQATDEGLRHIGKITGLEELYIWDAKSVTDAGVSHLASLKNLKNIHINRSKLTDEGLALLSSLPKIETLSLQENHFTDAGLARLAGRERLKNLYIGLGDGHITDSGIAHLIQFTSLEVLDLQKSQVTARGLEQLRPLSKLKQLWVSETGVTDAEKQAMRQANPTLTIK